MKQTRLSHRSRLFLHMVPAQRGCCHTSHCAYGNSVTVSLNCSHLYHASVNAPRGASVPRLDRESCQDVTTCVYRLSPQSTATREKQHSPSAFWKARQETTKNRITFILSSGFFSLSLKQQHAEEMQKAFLPKNAELLARALSVKCEVCERERDGLRLKELSPPTASRLPARCLQQSKRLNVLSGNFSHPAAPHFRYLGGSLQTAHQKIKSA